MSVAAGLESVGFEASGVGFDSVGVTAGSVGVVGVVGDFSLGVEASVFTGVA